MSIDEIADLKHKAVQTIKNDLNKARKEFNKYIQKAKCLLFIWYYKVLFNTIIEQNEKILKALQL